MLLNRTETTAPKPSDPSAAMDAATRDHLARAIALVADDLAAVEVKLRDLLQSSIPQIPNVAGHLAFAGGKRLRPLLVLLGAKAARFDGRETIVVAAVGELMHTATLLHDDVVDGGEFRRGRASARMKYGNAAAVLTGDYCYARAVQAMAHTGNLLAVQTMSDAVTLMAEGEVAQLDAAGNWNTNRTDYLAVIDRKTAALIAWCSSVGGIVEQTNATALRRYGQHVGRAFQIADDVLDYALGVECTGKARGQDLQEGKLTLPLLLAMELDPNIRHQAQTLLEIGPPLDGRATTALLNAVVDCGALDQASKVAENHARSAIQELAQLPESPARSALAGLAMQVARRST